MKTLYMNDEIKLVFNYESLRDLAGSVDKFDIIGFYLYFLPIAIRTLAGTYHFTFAQGLNCEESIDSLQRFIVARCEDANVTARDVALAMNGHSDALNKIFTAIFIDTYEIGRVLRKICETFYNSERFQAELWLKKHAGANDIKIKEIFESLLNRIDYDSPTVIDAKIYDEIPMGFRAFA